MSDSDILEYIRNNFERFSKRQRLIASYVLEHCDDAAYMTAAALAEKVNVSESTVVRFVSELGFNGYQKFQRLLQEVTRNSLTGIQRMEIASRRISEESVVDDVLKSDIDKIEQALGNIDREQFEKAVEALINADNIYILGARSAGILVRFARLYFNLIFDNVKAIETNVSDDIFEHIIRVKEGDVVIGMSFPRYSKSTVKAMEFAQKRGATIIALTDSYASPLIKPATYTLVSGNGGTDSFADSLVAPLSVLNAVICALGMKKKDEISKTFETLEDIWEEYEVY